MTRPFSPWLVAAAIAVGGACLGGGIWLGRQQGAGSASLDPRRQGLDREISTLQQQSLAGSTDPAQQQRLLELLVASGRKGEATTLLEQLADQHPERWELRLLLAELRRDQGDRNGALRETRQVLNARPDQIEALQLLTLLQLEQGNSAQALQQVQASFARQSQPRPRPEALPTGLLLAELLQKRGAPGQAEAVLVKLAVAFPADQRPLLARALMQQQRGDTKAAQESLAQAKALKPGQNNAALDQVASSWGLAKLRGPLRSPTSTSSVSSGSGNP